MATVATLDSAAPLPPAAPAHGDETRFQSLARRWVVLLPALAFAASALQVLATNYWSTEQGAQGPVILIAGGWLLWNRSAGLPVSLNWRRTLIALAAIVPIGLASVLAAMTVKQFLQAAGIYAALVCLIYAYVGTNGLRKLWPALGYLAFLIPPPENLVVPVTHALKGYIATWAVVVLQWLHYPIAHNMETLFIGPYEVVVAAACSGMNSLVGLFAIGLFYSYLMHPQKRRYALILSVLMIPVAVFTNFVRVILILLVTYHFGNATAQGVLHETMGMIMFFFALGVLVLLDKILHGLFLRRRSGRAAVAHG
jgi:exosortase